MLLGTPIFLFLFLPLALILYYFARDRFKAGIALLASLAFYTWGNPVLVVPMLALILLNYWFGRKIEEQRIANTSTRIWLNVAVLFNLGLLVFYKAFAGYGVELLNQGGRPQYAWIFQTPLGLSYIAFQVISYLVDVHEEKCSSEKNLLTFALYILLFPRIIAGPITAYRNLREQLASPHTTAANMADGLRRFIIGLAKKLLIADQLAVLVDPAFQLPSPNLMSTSAWLVIFAYALQIFFDFSGYTDMAIGLGQAMGFRFAENFNFPYIARSLSDFWRRWHMSLVGWFREYVFYPLEFARRKSRFLRQQTNILLVFALTGLWHGFTLNYLVWGAMHGLILGLELTRFGRWMKTVWAPIQLLYTLGIVLVGWVFFRSSDLGYAFSFLERMFIYSSSATLPVWADLSPIPNTFWIALLGGILFSVPIMPALGRKISVRMQTLPIAMVDGWAIVRDILFLLLFIFSILVTVNSTHQAYIYMKY
jgi:alginate O-acetyltransferase complex protein AlgI